MRILQSDSKGPREGRFPKPWFVGSLLLFGLVSDYKRRSVSRTYSCIDAYTEMHACVDTDIVADVDMDTDTNVDLNIAAGANTDI